MGRSMRNESIGFLGAHSCRPPLRPSFKLGLFLAHSETVLFSLRLDHWLEYLLLCLIAGEGSEICKGTHRADCLTTARTWGSKISLKLKPATMLPHSSSKVHKQQPRGRLRGKGTSPHDQLLFYFLFFFNSIGRNPYAGRKCSSAVDMVE